jgi:hypothetical protein
MRVTLALTVVLGCSGPATSSQPATTTPVEPAPVATTEPTPSPAPEPARPPSRPVERVAAAELESPSTSPRAKPRSQAEIAARLNDEGKTALLAGEPATASAKFREAVARVPEPSYFYNLCLSLYQEGKFGEALTACNAVENNDPTPALAQKTTKLMERIKAEAKRQAIQLEP